MSHPYFPQSRYSYRPGFPSQAPVPANYGLGGYSAQSGRRVLGSLSPKYDWALPSYVQKEPTGVNGFGGARETKGVKLTREFKSSANYYMVPQAATPTSGPAYYPPSGATPTSAPAPIFADQITYTKGQKRKLGGYTLGYFAVDANNAEIPSVPIETPTTSAANTPPPPAPGPNDGNFCANELRRDLGGTLATAIARAGNLLSLPVGLTHNQEVAIGNALAAKIMQRSKLELLLQTIAAPNMKQEFITNFTADVEAALGEGGGAAVKSFGLVDSAVGYLYDRLRDCAATGGAPSASTAAGMDMNCVVQKTSQGVPIYDPSMRDCITDPALQEKFTAATGITWPPADAYPPEYPPEEESYVMARPGAAVALASANQKNIINQAMKAAMIRGEFANPGDMSGQYAQNCVREGGAVTWDAAGKIQCNPTAAGKVALEAKCRATGFVPSWMQGRKGQQMRCLPPGIAAGAGTGLPYTPAAASSTTTTMVALAGAAALAFMLLGK